MKVVQGKKVMEKGGKGPASSLPDKRRGEKGKLWWGPLCKGERCKIEKVLGRKREMVKGSTTPVQGKEK